MVGVFSTNLHSLKLLIQSMVCLYIRKATMKESGREEETNGVAVYKSPKRKWVNGRNHS